MPFAATAAPVTSVQGLTGAISLFTNNAQTGTYQVLAGDFSACKVITVASGTFTITLVASGTQPANGLCIKIINYGTGVVTVARSGQNINGAAANLTIPAGTSSVPSGMNVWSDGANYFALPITPQGTPILLSEQVVSGTAATITFSSIPGTYRNLRLVMQARCDLAATFSDGYLQFNGDTAANYFRQYVNGNTTSAGAGESGAAKVGMFSVECANGLASFAAPSVIEIPNYSGSTFKKASLSTSLFVNSTSITNNMFVSVTGSIWNGTPAAITSIVIGLTGSGNFITGSVFDLYAQ
jgi:hypothetical protein